MPKATHFHTNNDALSTDKKFRPEDEKIFAQDKQEFRESEQDKKHETRSEKEFVDEQDETERTSNGD